MKITYKDKIYNYDKGVMFADIARDLCPEDFRSILAVKVNEALVGLYTPVEIDATIEFITYEAPEGKDIYDIVQLILWLKLLRDYIQMLKLL